MQKKTNKWIDNNDNYVLKGRGFYISYNPDTNVAGKGLGMLLNMLGNAFEETLEDDGRAETALVVTEGRNKGFYILNGDFRKQYEKIYSKGFKECHKFYLSKVKHRSNWSTDYHD